MIVFVHGTGAGKISLPKSGTSTSKLGRTDLVNVYFGSSVAKRS